MTTKVTGSYVGIGLMLKSPMMAAMVLARAELVKAAAEEAAPVGSLAREDDEHAGRYKASFVIEIGTSRRGNRVEAFIRNSAPEAILVEKGDSTSEGLHVMMRALSAVRGI